MNEQELLALARQGDGAATDCLLEKYKPKSEGYKRYYAILADSKCLITNNDIEQKQIGTFFRHLDHLITLHRHELEELQNIKKTMLEKMFV